MKLVFGILITAFVALGLAAKQKSEDKAVVQATHSPCIYNTTHCSCGVSAKSGTCLRHTSGKDTDGTCVVDVCQAGGYTCDCDGPSICKLDTCSNFYPSDSTPASKLTPGSSVVCSLRKSNACVKQIPKASTPIYKMVQFGDATAANMFNVSLLTDTGNFIQNNGFQMNDNWDHYEMLQPRHITMRLYKGDGKDANMLCAVYNTHGHSDDQLGDMSVDVKIKGLASQKLNFVACDDASECPTKAKSTLSAKHVLGVQHSDGWCVSPVTWDGNGISVTFAKVENFAGLTFADGDGPVREYLFKGGEGGLSGVVDKNGLVAKGKVPEMIFNIGGIEVP